MDPLLSCLGLGSNLVEDDDEDRLDEDFDYTNAFQSEDAEPSSMDTHLPEHNIGYKLLTKMGWSKGRGLGREGGGRVVPIPIVFKDDSLGVGKSEELDTYHVESTAKRKALDSERLLEETDEQRMDRETKVARVEAIKDEIKTVTAAFYCALCDKQYSKISEYEAHLSSYDHHHRKRFKEMQDMSKRGALPGMKKKAKEDKERAREEKELQRMQAALKGKFGSTAGNVGESSAESEPGNAADVEVPDKSAQANSGEGQSGGWNLTPTVGSHGDSNPRDEGATDGKPAEKGAWSAVQEDAKEGAAKVSFGFGMAKKGTQKAGAAPVKFSFGMKKK
ncbi:hypothetical protein HDV00_004443 [Rhizophlyctis rosea]|nr:hypothetical protein HDV00_004443 [Rhizophlyctis rosea]